MKKVSFAAPFLKRMTVIPDKVDKGEFPFNRLTYLADEDFELNFTAPVTFLVGENGSGKSTLLEALAMACKFPVKGGSRDHLIIPDDEDPFVAALRLSWLPKVPYGFFFRAESFFNVASFLDGVSDVSSHGGRELHCQSHGEAFLAMFVHRLNGDKRAIYLLDEPEAALSPSRQLAFLRVMWDWCQSKQVQAIIATHSPILMAYPDAWIYRCGADPLEWLATLTTGNPATPWPKPAGAFSPK